MPRRKTAGASPGKRAQSVAAREDLLLRGCGLGPRKKTCDTNDAERKDGSQSEPNLRYLHKKFKKMAEAVGAEGGAGGGNGGGGAVAAVAVEAASADTSPVEASPPPPASPPSSSNDASSSSSEESKRKAPLSGRHVCPYCKLACAKPSVLQKHVRAHTNERPFPCRPCGLAFKTKSNLYKHCRSRSHALKAERPSSAVPEGGGGVPEEEDADGISNCMSEEEGEEEDGGGGATESKPPSPPIENPSSRSPGAESETATNNNVCPRPRTIYKPKFHTAALYREEEEQQQRRATTDGGAGGSPVSKSSEVREDVPPSQHPPVVPCPEYLRRHVTRIIDENRAIVEGGERAAWSKKRMLGQRSAPSNRVARGDSPPRSFPDGPTPGESRLAHALLRPPPEQPLNLSRGGGTDTGRWDARVLREEDSPPSNAPPCRSLEAISPRPREVTRGEVGQSLRTCPLCRAQFRDEESLEAHRMCYCEGRSPTYGRKASVEAEDGLMGACLPSPGPLLGNTPLVDGYGPASFVPKAGPPPKKRRTDVVIPRTLRPSVQEPPLPVMRTVEEQQMPESPSLLSARPANAVHLFGGEVRIREGTETKTLRIEMGARGGGGTGGEVLRREDGGSLGNGGMDAETVVTIARSGLHSGGTIVHVRKTSSCEDDGSSGVASRRQKARGGRRSLAPSPTGESSPPTSLSLPIAPQITTPDLAPDLRAPFGSFPTAPPAMEGMILSYDPTTLAPPSFRAVPVSVPLRPSPPPALTRSASASSGVLTIFHGGRPVPFVPGMPGPQGSPHPLPSMLSAPSRSPRPLDLAADHGTPESRLSAVQEVKEVHPNNVMSKAASPPVPSSPAPLPPLASPAATSANGSGGRESDIAEESPNKRTRFLRPSSLPLKPGTYPLKKHSQGNTPLGISSSSGASLVSPETPRPRKSYGQLYLNGHAYTYLGLKCSTRPSFCCAHRRPPQPMYVAQGPAHPRLSMYSNWKVCEAVTAEPFGLEPGKAMRLYDSRHRPSGTSVAPSQPVSDSEGPNAMILTHSSYWLLKKEREGSGEKEDDVVNKQEETMPEEKVEKEMVNEKVIPVTLENEKQKESEVQCPKTTAEGDAPSQPPARVKIFAGGFESNEEYIYVRGRGRGRYVCEECGIRCKKPSMLKKHIRTHTDVRPFTCRHCCFSFKTKGNLTKHMKSKAHFKKCVEMGIVPVPTTVDESHIDEESLAKQQALRAASLNEADSDTDDDDEEDEEEEEDEEDEEEDENTDAADSTKGKMEQEEREVARSLLSLSESVDLGNGIGRIPAPVDPSSNYPPHSGLTPLLSRPRSYPYLSHLPDETVSLHPMEEKGDTQQEVEPPSSEAHMFPVTSSSTLVAVASGQRYYFPSRRDTLERTADEGLGVPTPAAVAIKENVGGDCSPLEENAAYVSSNGEMLSHNGNDMVDGAIGSGPVDLSRGSASTQPSALEERAPKGSWKSRAIEESVRFNSRTLAQQSYVIPSALPQSPYGTPGTPTTPVREHPSEILAPVPSDSAALLASLCSTVDKLPPSTLDSSGDGSVITTPTVDDNIPGSGTMLQAYLTERALQDVRLKRQQRSPFHPSAREEQVDGSPISVGSCNVITSIGSCSTTLTNSNASKEKPISHSLRINSPSFEGRRTPLIKINDSIQEMKMQVKTFDGVSVKEWLDADRENGEPSVFNVNMSAPASRNIERSVVVQSDAPHSSSTLKTSDGHLVGDSHSLMSSGGHTEGIKSSQAAGPRLVSCSPKAEFMPPLGGPSSSYAGVTEDGRSMCAICHKVFSKASQLRLHVNIHYFERPFRCDSCAVSFRTRGHLQKHQRSVSHQNKVSMNSTFGMPTTENPRPFKCGDCKIAFRIHGHLAKHLRSKMHIMRLECVGKLPFGTYAEVERSGISLADIDTSDCENSLESLQILAQKLYEKDPTKLQHWERTRALSESSEDEAIAYHRDESGHGIPGPNGPIHSGALMRTSVLEHSVNRNAYCGTLASDYEDASDGETHLVLQPPLTRSFICDFCDAGFTSKQLLQNHLLVHQESSPDNCL